MNKKLLVAVVIGVLVVAVGVIFVVFSNTGTSSPKSGQQLSQKNLLQDLGIASTQVAKDPLYDEGVTESALNSKKSYDSIFENYGILPEQLLSSKQAMQDMKSSGQEVYPNPKINFKLAVSDQVKNSLDVQKASVSQIGSVPIYSFETNFNDTYLKNLATGMGIDESTLEVAKDRSSGEYLLTNFKTGQSVSQNSNIAQAASGSADPKLIFFNPASGSFTLFQSSNKINRDISSGGTESAQQPIEIAQNFLFNNNVLKPYTYNLDQSETTTYERKDSLDITYVAFHRGWSPLPIINSTGASNISRLDDTIKKTITDPLSQYLLSKDDQVVNTSDKLDGFARADDFNTITVAINNKTNTVFSLVSNIRPVKESKAAKANLISADEAIKNATGGQIYKSIITPQGSGSPNIAAMYPEGIASSDNAQVGSIYLAYMEQPLNQRLGAQQPVYIMTGEAKLKTGYNVDFSFVTPAIKNQELSPISFSEASADQTQSPANNIQIGFTTPDNIVGDKPDEPASKTPDGKCDETDSQYQPKCPAFSHIQEINGRLYRSGYGNTRSFTAGSQTMATVDVGGGILWELVPYGSAAATNKQNKTEIVNKFIELSGLGGSAEAKKMIGGDLSVYGSTAAGFHGQKCFYKCLPYTLGYVSGRSPIIYLYSKSPQAFGVQPISQDKISYNYPATANGTWDIITKNDGTLEYAGKNYSNLYYEFMYKNIVVPSEGYMIEKDRAAQFLKDDLLPRLNLGQKEISDYLADIQTHIFNLTKSDTKYYKISILNKSEVERFLPLQVNPRPAQTIRNMLVFEQMQDHPNYRIPEPAIEQINRNDVESLLVENGCLLK